MISSTPYDITVTIKWISFGNVVTDILLVVVAIFMVYWVWKFALSVVVGG